ncbi:MAG: hypothetical protein PHY47_12705 [Lachnospiraceae bacterium]|nr:hypothetical protein [Lachnospiraceae bacterium]
MNIVKSRYDGIDKEIKIIPSGDWHLGHKNCVIDLIKQWTSELSETNRGILMGDLAECATKDSIGKGLFDTNMMPEKQYEYIISLLEPYADYIDGAIIGNHEERLVNSTSFDITKLICNKLNIPYLHYNGYIKYSWNKVAYTFNIWHGAGKGSTSANAIKQCEDMSNRCIADVYLMGHVHKLLKSDRIVNIPDVRNMKVNKIKQYFITTGSALDYDDGYAEMKGLQPRILGYPTVILSGIKGSKEIEVRL